MIPDISSLLTRQVRLSTTAGGTEEAMARMRRFLELEREAKKSHARQESRGLSNLRKLAILRPV